MTTDEGEIVSAVIELRVTTRSGSRYLVHRRGEERYVSRLSEIPLRGAVSGRDLDHVIAGERIVGWSTPVVGRSWEFATEKDHYASTTVVAVEEEP